MIKNIILCLLIPISLFCEAQNKFSINGKITNISNAGLKNGDTVFLEFQANNLSFRSIIANNKFKFEGVLDESSIAMLQYKGSGLKLFVDTNTFNITLIEKEISPNRYLYNKKITTKSPLHINYTDFVNLQVELTRKKMQLANHLDSTNDSSIRNLLKQQVEEVDLKINQSFKDNATLHNNNLAAAYVLTAAPDFSYQNYIKVYDQFSDQIKNSSFGKVVLSKLNTLKNFSEANTTLTDNGNLIKLPVFSAIDLVGKSYRLDSSFFKGNKYTLIEFWASWCGPCKPIATEFRLKEVSYQQKGLRIVGFSLDSDQELWKNGVIAEKSKWLQLSDLKVLNSPFVKFMKYTSIPSNVIINEKGFIVGRNLYGEELDKFLNY